MTTVKTKQLEKKPETSGYRTVFGQFGLPSDVFERASAFQRKNLEALGRTGQIAFDGMNALLRHQTEVVHRGLGDASELYKELLKPVGAEERMAQHAEASKKALEKGIAHFLDLSQLVAEAYGKAFDVIADRVEEGLDELRAVASPRNAAA